MFLDAGKLFLSAPSGGGLGVERLNLGAQGLGFFSHFREEGAVFFTAFLKFGEHAIPLLIGFRGFLALGETLFQLGELKLPAVDLVFLGFQRGLEPLLFVDESGLLGVRLLARLLGRPELLLALGQLEARLRERGLLFLETLLERGGLLTGSFQVELQSIAFLSEGYVRCQII